MKRILFFIVCIFLISAAFTEAGTSDKNAQTIKSGRDAAPEAAQISTSWMPGAEASVGSLRIHYTDAAQSREGGTGFLMAPNLVVTCLHVVNGANSAEITFPSGSSLPITGIVAEDTENDLAILTITPTGADPPPLPLAPVPTQVGDKIVMHGYPAGPSQKVCSGNVTCIGPSYGMPVAVITSMPTAHGFSGGPALNDQRQVVGIVMGSRQHLAIEGKEISKKQGILTPASCITSLVVGPSRSLKDWTKARGAIASASTEVYRGALACEQEDWDRAFQHFQKATQLDPNNFMAWFRLGGSLQEKGRDDQAKDATAKALTLKPQFPEALLVVGEFFIKQQRYPEAIETFERALRMNPNSDREHFLLGWTYVRAGQSEKAREQYQALKSMNLKTAEYLLVLIQKMDAFSPLIWVAKEGNLQVVQTLLADGADINAKDTTDVGATALMWAALNGHTEVVKLLLEKGADVNAKSKNGETALMMTVMEGYTENVKLLLEKGAEVNTKKTDDGATALIMAAMKGHTEVVKLLLEKGADINVKRTTDGITALWMASQNGHTEVVKLLLEKGADVNVKNTTDGRTALMMASGEGYVEVVKLLLGKGADVNAKSKNDATALMMSAQDGHVEVIKLLLEKGADVNVKRTDDGVTALIMAAYKGHTKVVKLLLEKGADVNAKSKNGATALMMSAQDGHTEVVKLLLEKGADVNVKNTTDGRTALIMASGEGYVEVVKLLLGKGADVNAKVTINNIEWTALKMAKGMGHTDIVQLLEKAGAKE
jgi:ankyrin repeat protein/Tfp pilus assembly protein PilF